MRFLDDPSPAVAARLAPYRAEAESVIHAAPDPVVLVVEDDRLLRRMTCETLCEEGLEAIPASGGDEALRLMERHAGIELLFTDINMPGMNGLALSIVARSRRPALKVVVTSGRQFLERHELPASGKFLPKPYTAMQLIRTVRSSLAE